jgi:hypothetical protein
MLFSADLILSVTQELRSLDPNQQQFISSEGPNAGLLPLVGEQEWNYIKFSQTFRIIRF